MSNKHLFVVIIVVAMVLWVLSGSLRDTETSLDNTDTAREERALLVRGERSLAQNTTLYLDVRGQTQANRTVQVKAEISGKIVELPGEKGKWVKAGEPLCKIAIDARQNEYEEAKAQVRSAQLEYDGVANLKSKGLQSEVLLAKAEAVLEQSKTRARQTELALQKTSIVAPFNAVVQHQPVEIGDFLSPGSTCVSVIEIDPILVVGQVAEKNISSIYLDDTVEIELITGESYEGKITYIGNAPDATTRTFPVEVTVSNPGGSIRAGITTNMRVPIGREWVHRMSPASLVLDDLGKVGIKIVDTDNRVRFVEVDIVNESPDGVLVKGLEEDITYITVGQEETYDGQLVELDLTPLTNDVRISGN